MLNYSFSKTAKVVFNNLLIFFFCSLCIWSNITTKTISFELIKTYCMMTKSFDFAKILLLTFFKQTAEIRDVNSNHVQLITFCTFQLAFGIFQMGFITSFLSQPLIKALTSGAAVLVVTAQTPSILGITPMRRSGFGLVILVRVTFLCLWIKFEISYVCI